MATVGIDIGTCYSSICVLDANGRAERVKVATGTGFFGDSYSLPSAVYAEDDGRLLLGQSAMASRMRKPENFKGEFKRDLGQFVPYQLGDREYYPQDLYKEFFIYLKRCAETYLNESVGKATITCPAAFNKSRKQLVLEAAMRAGLLDAELLDEPSAAAFGYWDAKKVSKGDTLLVYDLGGGTFDVALLRCTGEGFEPMAQPLGLPNSGGMDLDKLIFDHIMDEIGEEKLAQVRTNKEFSQKFALQVMEMAVKAKHHLSSAETFADVIPVGFSMVDYTLTRSTYNNMITPIIDGTMQQVRAIIKNAGITEKDVTTTLLVGGGSRTPLVRDMLTRLMGKEPLSNIDPELAVCAGAAVFRKKRMEPEIQKQTWKQEIKYAIRGTDEEQYGNSNGNIINGGCVAKYGDMIIYVRNDGIYGYNTYTKAKHVIDQADHSSTYYLNTYRNWLYYFTYNQGAYIYRINLEDTAKKNLVKKTDHFVDCMMVFGDWLYVSDGDILYRKSLDKSGQEETLCPNCYKFNLHKGIIYYTRHDFYRRNHPDGNLYRISLDRKKSFNDKYDGFLKITEADFVVMNDLIYYNSTSNHLRSYSLDGKGHIKNILFTECNHYNIGNDAIIFSNAISPVNINSAGLSGENRTVLFKNSNYSTCYIVDEWVYTPDPFQRIRPNGTGYELLE